MWYIGVPVDTRGIVPHAARVAVTLAKNKRLFKVKFKEVGTKGCK